MNSQKKKLKKSETFKEIRKFGRKFFDFFLGGMQCIIVGNLNTLNISYFFVTLYMPWDIEIHNRIRIGFAIGFQYYGEDDLHDWSEVTIFLGLISIVIKY